MDTEYIPLRDVRFVVSNQDAVSHGRFYLLVADSLPAGVKVANDDATCKMVEADPNRLKSIKKFRSEHFTVDLKEFTRAEDCKGNTD